MSGRFFIDHGMWHDRKTGRHLEDMVSEVPPDARFSKLLEAVAGYDQTPEEAQAELEADGVNVDAFLARIAADERQWINTRMKRAESRLNAVGRVINELASECPTHHMTGVDPTCASCIAKNEGNPYWPALTAILEAMRTDR